MDVLIPILGDLIDMLGLDFVLRALVEAGVLPSWVLPDVFNAVEHEPYLIEGQVQTIKATLEDPRIGLDAIKTTVSRLANDRAAILAAISNIQTQISNLPVPPSLDGVPEAVWNWGHPNIQSQMWDLAGYAGLAGRNIGYSRLPMPGNPWFAYMEDVTWGEGDRIWVAPPTPAPDWTAIGDGDTPLSWLQSTDTSGLTWTFDDYAGQPAASFGQYPTTNAGTIWFVMPAAQFNTLKPTQPSPTISVPPVWTDLAHATLGDTVELLNGMTVTGPLSGVIVSITGHPPGAGVFGFGDLRSWGHAGACMFLDDQGHAEWPISLGPQDQLITPRSMQVASSAVIRVGAGYSGTVTPWLASGG